MRRVAACGLVIAAGLTACGASTSEAPPVAAGNPPQTAAPPESATADSSASNRKAVCDEFIEITADYTLDDDQSAARYLDLATRTEDQDLARAIRAVGNAFSRHDASISSDAVQQLCGT
jgi:hypothetical protein